MSVPMPVVATAAMITETTSRTPMYSAAVWPRFSRDPLGDRVEHRAHTDVQVDALAAEVVLRGGDEIGH